jgi:hypothetical protein
MSCQTRHPGVPKKWFHVQHTKAFATTKTDEMIMQAMTIRRAWIAAGEELASEVAGVGATLVADEFIRQHRIE